MANLSMCKWEKCVQNPICHRYNAIPEAKDQVYMHFENLCDQNNNWKWYYGDKDKMIKVELIEDEIIKTKEKEEEIVHSEKKDDA